MIRDSFNILAMSGGGTRLFAMMRLLNLMAHHDSDFSIADFDLLALNSASTSIGKALSKPHPDDPSRPYYNTDDGRLIAHEIVPPILDTRCSSMVKNLWREGSICSTNNMQNLLRDHVFGDTRLDESVTRLLFSVHKNDVPAIMTNFDCNGLLDTNGRSFENAGHMPMHQSSAAAMALRPYFQPVVNDMGDLLSDGGIDIPFPAMEAWLISEYLLKAEKTGEEAGYTPADTPSGTALLGITNGYAHTPGWYNRHFSSVGGIKREIDMINAASRAIADLEAIIVHEEFNDIQVPTDSHLNRHCREIAKHISESVTDTSENNIWAMETAAEVIFEHHRDEFERYLEILKHSRQTREEKNASPAPGLT